MACFGNRRLAHPATGKSKFHRHREGRQRQLRRVRAGRPRSIRATWTLAPGRHGAGKNGEIVATGAGAAALGHPPTPWPGWPTRWAAWALRWKAGDVVLSGSLGIMVPVQTGDKPARDHRRHRRLLSALRLRGARHGLATPAANAALVTGFPPGEALPLPPAKAREGGRGAQWPDKARGHAYAIRPPCRDPGARVAMHVAGLKV